MARQPMGSADPVFGGEVLMNMGLLKACLDDVKGKIGGVKSDLGLAGPVNHAIAALQDFDRMHGPFSEASDPGKRSQWTPEVQHAFPFRTVLLPLVLGLHSNKPNLCTICLVGVHHILTTRLMPATLVFDGVLTSSKAALISGKAAAWVIVEALTLLLGVSEHALQHKTMDSILIAGLDLRLDVSGQLLEQVLRTVFNLHLTSSNTLVKVRAASLLQHIIRERIMKLASVNCARSERNGATLKPHHTFSVAPGNDPTDPALEVTEGEMDFYQVLRIPVVTTYLWPPSAESHLRDALLVLHTLLALAVKPIPNTICDINAIEVRSRVFALDLVAYAFASVDEDHQDLQHRALLPDLVGRLRFEVWKAVARNLAYSLPFALFDGAVTLLTQLSLKCHHMHQDDLRWFHDLVVAPLLKSRFSPIETKLRLLEHYRAIFSNPAVLVAYWINYEAITSSFDEGFVSAMVRTVVETMAIDFNVSNERCKLAHPSTVASVLAAEASKASGSRSSGAQKRSNGGATSSPSAAASSQSWAVEAAVVLSEDQLALLRFDCAATINEVLGALLRWISDEPMPYDRPGSLSDEAQGADAAASCPEVQPPYSWRYIHQLHCNHGILNEARVKFALSWRDAHNFLRERRVVDGTPRSLAEFMRGAQRFDRGQLCAIFERVLKEPFCMEFVRAYFSFFKLADVPLDVALRDTTLEFMSFDRPMFEAQVWDCVMHLFGVEYASQNNGRISAADADALSGVILFLHTNLHNPKNKDKLGAEDFAKYGNECVAVPLERAEMIAIYTRVSERMWTRRPDALGTLRNFVVTTARSLPIVEPSKESMLESTELGGNMAAYAENFGHLTKSQQSALVLMQYVTECIDRFNEAAKAVHAARLVSTGDAASAAAKAPPRVWMPAYCVPYYAHHVQPMLVALHPLVYAAAYLASRMATNQRHARLAQQMFARIDDLRGAFGFMPSQATHAHVTSTVQHCLRQELAADLGPIDGNIALHFTHPAA